MPLSRTVALCAAILVTLPDGGAPDAMATHPSPDTTRAFARIDSLLEAFIEKRAFPGAAVAIGQHDRIHKLTGYGTYTYESARATTPQSVFDLASLTKVIATTTAAMLLYEDGRLHLDATVHSYLPEFGSVEKSTITIRHLLTHTGGFTPFRNFYADSVLTREAVLDSIFTIALDSPPGTRYQYSDFGMITLALVLEAITGRDFATFAKEHIFEPLNMQATAFRGTGTPDTAVVPTERDDYFRHRLVQGEVHDENAWILGGAAGHAGLFSSAEDVARFASMMAQDGRYGDSQFLKPTTVAYFSTVANTVLSSRALGWDTKSKDKPSSAGEHFGPRSFGHTGFTGTSMWIDPDTGIFVVLLTNRVHPTRRNSKISKLRPLLADMAYEALAAPD